MSTEELYDDEGNLITNDNDTTDYKSLFEKEKAEREKRENRFKWTAKELNEYKQTKQSQEPDDDGINGANEYLKNHWSKVLREELWFVSKEDLDSMFDARMQRIEDIKKIDKFPQLADQKDAILELSKVKWLSIEETIKTYKFLNEDSMENFHKPTIGSRKKTPWSIDIDNPTEEDLIAIKKMTPEEFNKFIWS